MTTKIAIGIFIVLGIASTLYLRQSKGFFDSGSEYSMQQVLTKDTSLTFQERISKIKKKVVDLTSTSDLFAIQEFAIVYENPMAYVDDAKDFILNSNSSATEKEIVVYSMNRLDIEQYRLFVSICHQSFKKGNLIEDVLARAIAYPFSRRMVIVENYEDNGVRELLNAILLDEKVSSKLKYHVKDILSGKTWANIKKFRDESGY